MEEGIGLSMAKQREDEEDKLVEERFTMKGMWYVTLSDEGRLGREAVESPVDVTRGV